jgi:hypothetical protein
VKRVAHARIQTRYGVAIEVFRSFHTTIEYNKYFLRKKRGYPKIYKGLILCRNILLFDRASFNPVTVTTLGHSVSDSAIDKLIDATRLEEPTWQVVMDKHNQVAKMLLGVFISVGNSTNKIILKHTSHEITGMNTLLKESLQGLDMSHWQEAVNGVF